MRRQRGDTSGATIRAAMAHIASSFVGVSVRQAPAVLPSLLSAHMASPTDKYLDK